MAFRIALADATAAGHPRIAGTETTMFPAPTFVVYPEGLLGELIPTADGRLIVQQGSRDNRLREWHWVNYPGFLFHYERQFQFLRSLRSRFRYESGSGVSPFIYIQDDVSAQLRRKVQVEYTVASTGASSLTVTGNPLWATDALKNGVVEVLPSAAGGTGTGAYQRLTIAGNTNNSLTTVLPWAVQPAGASVLITYYTHPWFRCRVIDVDRKLSDSGGNVRYGDTWFKFVIDEESLSNQPDVG